MNTTIAAARPEPGELLRLVTERLANSGLDVRPPGPGEGCRTAIDCDGAGCTLTVSDWGSAEWEYSPWPPGDADPDLTADLATMLLTGWPGPYPRLGRRRQSGDITFKGVVGRELEARGLHVSLAACEDMEYFDVFAEIVAAAPGARGGEARVRVADDGCLTWTRSYQAEAAAVLSGPGFRGRIAEPASVAAAVTETVARAMSYLRPGGERRAA
ncbi:MAG: hypothetical protein ACRDOI_13700 [Trebonia sp.]